MKVKALLSFSGKISMGTGEIRDIENGEVLKDLLAARYVEEVKPQKAKKGVKENENQ